MSQADSAAPDAKSLPLEGITVLDLTRPARVPLRAAPCGLGLERPTSSPDAGGVNTPLGRFDSELHRNKRGCGGTESDEGRAVFRSLFDAESSVDKRRSVNTAQCLRRRAPVNRNVYGSIRRLFGAYGKRAGGTRRQGMGGIWRSPDSGQGRCAWVAIADMTAGNRSALDHDGLSTARAPAGQWGHEPARSASSLLDFRTPRWLMKCKSRKRPGRSSDGHRRVYEQRRFSQLAAASGRVLALCDARAPRWRPTPGGRRRHRPARKIQ